MSRKPKTEGLEWLIYSLMAFNGSGYADMNSPDDYLDSYIVYNEMKQRNKAVALAHVYRIELLPTIEEVLKRTQGASRQPSEKNMKKFEAQKQQTRMF